MAKDAFPFLAVLLGLSLIAGLLEWWFVLSVLVVVTAFVAFYFRDPDRAVPADGSLLVSPADGRVVRIESRDCPGVGPARRISIFLSVFNVHINRLPCEGDISGIQYYPGKFLAAFNPKASLDNERNSVWVRAQDRSLCVTQIAGLIARRIVCWKKSGDKGVRGERFGLIRFGSRVDLDVPESVELLVKVGDRVRGGSTPVARWPN